jgi:uncharacterized repeat protein (TIGR02543 family)
MPAEAVTFYAIWSPNAFTVTYSADNASGVTGLTGAGSYGYGSQISLPAGPSKSGYVFAGWCDVDPGALSATCTGNTYSAGAAYTVGSSATLYALWTQNVSVTYNANTGTGAPTDANVYQTGNTITVLVNSTPTLSGYTFGGWCTSQMPLGQPCTGSLYQSGGFTSFVAGGTNVTLYAVWSAVVQPQSSTPTTTPTTPTGPPVFVITFEPNGGSGTMAPQTVKTGATLTPNGFARTGYVFVGWNTQPNGTGSPLADAQAYPFASAITLYAQWRAASSSPAAQPVYDLGVVYFGTNLYSVATTVSQSTLRSTAAAIVAGKYHSLVLTGMTDLRASAAYNKALSQRRANAVEVALRAMLKKLGYGDYHFSVVAAGISTKYAGLAANRRVEISGTPGH